METGVAGKDETREEYARRDQHRARGGVRPAPTHDADEVKAALRDARQINELAEEATAPHVLRLRQRALRNRLHESLLFLPAVMLIGAVALEELAAWLDRHARVGALRAYQMPPDAAVTLLSTIAGATITTAGVVFSLLVVTLQLASGQFSPRVLRTFWRDRFGQVLIGLLLAAFTFCVLALTQIDTTATHAPMVTVLCALALALASIIAIVTYLNRISRQQYVGRIMERIGEETLRLIGELPYGPNIGARVGEPAPAPDPERLLAEFGPPLVVAVPADGWVQQISRRAILASVPAGSIVRLDTRVGAYLVRGEPFVTIWPRPEPSVAHQITHRVLAATILGNARTMQQDIDFGLRQLNDIALRALSPAVNDPTTAVEAVLRLSSVLRPLVRADLPDQCVRDHENRVLLTPWNLDHAEYVVHAFGQLRLYAAPHPQVAIALVRAVRMLRVAAAAAGKSDAVHALTEQVRLTVDGCARSGLGEADLAMVRAAAAG